MILVDSESDSDKTARDATNLCVVHYRPAMHFVYVDI